jgi:hypothetical protein
MLDDEHLRRARLGLIEALAGAEIVAFAECSPLLRQGLTELPERIVAPAVLERLS